MNQPRNINTDRIMQRRLRILLSASAASLMTLSTLGETPAAATPADTAVLRESRVQARADRLNGAVKTSDLIGMTVRNYQDEKLGKVEDLAVDVESGRVVQVILSSGGFAGLGDTLTAVPPGALHHDTAKKVVHLDSSKEKLAQAPRFEMAKWAECCDADHLSRVYRHFGQEPSLRFVHHGNKVVETRNDPGAHPMIPAERLGHSQRASQVAGTVVKNLQDETLGKVDNLLVDLPSGRLVAVVVSSGGFLGIGDELSAIPPTALRYTASRESLQLDASKERLANAPHFKSSEWPDFAQPSYTEGVYRAYRVDPYFVNDATPSPDGTPGTVRDRKHWTLTPSDQGTSPSDIDATSRIRKGIRDGKDMSVNARNVRIITNKGQVTLIGPVDSADEKRLIGEIANGVVLAANVDNQLEVR